MALLPSTDVKSVYHIVEIPIWRKARHAVLSPATWVGDTLSSPLAVSPWSCSVSDSSSSSFTVSGCNNLISQELNVTESPKFLLSQGKEQEAIDVLVRITKFNRQPPPTLTVEHFQEVEAAYLALHPTDPSVEAPRNQATYSHVTKRALSSLKNIKGIFATKLQSFIFVLLAIAYMVCIQLLKGTYADLQGDYWSFNLAGAFLPIILLRNNVDNGRGTVQDTYAQYVYIKLPGVIGAVLGLLAVDLPLVGRKWSLVFSAILQGMAMAMYTQVNTTAGYVGLNAFAYVMQTLFNAILYASAPELFDTSFRGSASGMLSCLGRVAGIVAPIAGE
jgi:hypothetical protein